MFQVPQKSKRECQQEATSTVTSMFTLLKKCCYLNTDLYYVTHVLMSLPELQSFYTQKLFKTQLKLFTKYVFWSLLQQFEQSFLQSVNTIDQLKVSRLTLSTPCVTLTAQLKY